VGAVQEGNFLAGRKGQLPVMCLSVLININIRPASRRPGPSEWSCRSPGSSPPSTNRRDDSVTPRFAAARVGLRRDAGNRSRKANSRLLTTSVPVIRSLPQSCCTVLRSIPLGSNLRLSCSGIPQQRSSPDRDRQEFVLIFASCCC
jgi:hypothetical protein